MNTAPLAVPAANIRRTATALALFAALMLAAAFAAVPLYRLFCQATGYAGTTQRGTAASASAAERSAAARVITVRFDANTAPGMPWRFAPKQVTQQVQVGRRGLAYYRATNPTPVTTYGQAVYNVSPDTVGRYFVKIACFCFNEQTLGPGQSAHMPVMFYIDPALLDDPEAAKVKEITLSYTFFPGPPPPGKSAPPAAPAPARARQAEENPMASAKSHAYHILPPSPWPLVMATAALLFAAGGIGWMHKLAWGPWVFALGVGGILGTMYLWWSDVVREANAGDHTPVVQLHHRYGMILFIASEIMFFVAWFWAYFSSALYPSNAAVVGGVWPPKGIEVLDPFEIPLLNTFILLLSGTTVTWAHHALIEGKRDDAKFGLWLTVGLGLVFSSLQAFEYAHAGFGLAGNVYGSTFYLATGFHGFHVIMGTIFLAVCLKRLYSSDFSPRQHFGFEAAAWYWHFVDVVWLFLFLVIYVVGSRFGAAVVHGG